MKRIKKSYWVIAAIAVMIACSFAFTAPKNSQYKNLKVLPKNITKPELDSLMKSFTKALGVKCDYCHYKSDTAQWPDFASDRNEVKLTARYMIKMQGKINKKFFEIKDSKAMDAKLKVSCFTCHHGTGTPATKPPATAESK